MAIHSTAIVHESVQVAPSCEIGPYSIIDEGVNLGANVVISAHCHVFPSVTIGKGTKLFDGVVVGSEPQDKKYAGEPTRVVIGENNQIREYVTISRGTKASGETRIGSGCLLMAYTHIAHDCVVGDAVIIANGVQMGGHVNIGSSAIISGMTGIHQFTHIGEASFIGGGLRVARNILPYSKALGDPLTFAGVNQAGIIRKGYSLETAGQLKKIFRQLKPQSKETFFHEMEKMEAVEDASQGKELQTIMDTIKKFLADSSRPCLL